MDWAFGGGFQPRRPLMFESQYCCSSTAMAGRDVDEGDKIYLPPSALDKLARMNVEYPMLFEITNHSVGKSTHCGVLEFSADEGWCYMPFWMMQNLLVEEASLVSVKNVSLRKASFVKLRAQSIDFLEVSNPRALLEVALRKFTCMTVGDTICIPYVNGKKFYLDVREVQPEGKASIIETDCNVDFEEPLGFKGSKYDYSAKASEAKDSDTAVKKPVDLQKAYHSADSKDANDFKAFTGSARRIDGKKENKADESKIDTSTVSTSSSISSASKSVAAVPSTTPATFQSRIGDKYSKKKTAVSAFTGTAHKLI